MNYELFFGTEVQLALAGCAFLAALAVLGFILDEDASPQIVIITGVLLIFLAAGGLAYIDIMKATISSLHSEKKVSDDFWANFQLRSNVFLFVFPFVTAAIGTNLISDVITKKLHYEKPLTFFGVLRGIPEFIKIILGLFLLPLVVVLIIPLMTIEKLKKHTPWFMDKVGIINRHLQLKLLKIGIIARNSKLNKALQRTSR